MIVASGIEGVLDLLLDTPSVSFSMTGGANMCVLIERSNFRECGYEDIATGLQSEDTIILTFPDANPPSQPDLSNSVPLRIQSSGSGENMIMQIGCEPDNYCLSYLVTSGSSDQALSYPVLSTAARLRVKVFGSDDMSYAQ